MEFKKFKFNDREIVGDIIPPDSVPKILILHGGGSANISRYSSLRDRLADEGLSSYAFDYIGHGETGGDLEGSSLKERTEITIEAIKHLDSVPETILGSSMGAYTAIKMLEHFEIKNLILFVPAIYSDESYTFPFGQEFTKAINKLESWHDSKVWNALATFTGNLLIVRAENDDVIPKELIVKIYNSAINAHHKEIYTAVGAPHSMTRFLNDNPTQVELLVNQIVNFLE